MLPAWLGAEVLQVVLDEGKLQLLQDMVQEWPFFRAVIDAEMVFAKSDHTLSAHYDQLLVEPDLAPVASASGPTAAGHKHSIDHYWRKELLLTMPGPAVDRVA